MIGPQKKQQGREERPARGGRGVGAGLAVGAGGVVLALVAALLVAKWLSGEPDGAAKDGKPVRGAHIAEVKPQMPKPAPPPKRDPLDDPKWDGLDKTRIRKAANGSYVYLPRPGEERFPGERAQALARIGGTNNTAAIDKRLVEDPEHPWMFHNMVQSDLVQYARPGEFAVPINPNISDEQAWEAINTPIGYHYNDTDTQVEEKLFVRDLLDDLKEYMEKGGHARDFFAGLHHKQEMEAEIMLKTRQEVHSILNSGDVEGARMALDAYNQLREQKGLPPMRIRKLNGPKSDSGK
jgi:hypothetical protein